MTKDFEGSFLDNRAADRGELIKSFNDAIEHMREKIRSDVTLDEAAQKIGLEMFDVSVDDLKQDILDRGMLYKGQTPKEQVRTFMESRIEKLREKQNVDQGQFGDFLKGI
ncbi:hypothetical protein HY414_01325 [Candidatus Kaiserbacteria bacterium]|nr:hypothetical protein [Candidatus Kaiserbacteria bacterium]